MHDLAITQWINGILACVIDITTALIPQFLLWKVKMRRSTRISLNLIFALGLITAAMSIGRVAATSYETVATDVSWREMTSKTFGLVEEKCGIIFASAPAFRQFAAYVSRRGTIFPTKDRQYPGEDFTRFRRRLNLRDLFWFRTPSLIEGRVLRPQRLFYLPPSDQISDSETLVDQAEKKDAEKSAEKSVLDVMTSRLKNTVGGGGASTKSQKIDKSSITKKSGSVLKTRLWNWESLNSRSESDHFGTRSSSDHVHGRLDTASEIGTQAIRIEHGFDVRSERSDSRQLLAEPSSAYHH
ncbi:MAG: hypothetical protein M1822_006732 [Bathelium mastoideum]|nr:MAG: hypothetical protein M1822_006732 [Bathelium mastoideum]